MLKYLVLTLVYVSVVSGGINVFSLKLKYVTMIRSALNHNDSYHTEIIFMNILI